VVPSLDEQAALVERIETRVAKLDALMAKGGRRLSDCRIPTALISAAVTGKLMLERKRNYDW